MILKNLCAIQGCNFTDFFKLRNFYCDLVLHNRRSQNHKKNRNVAEKSLVYPGKCFTKNVAFPHPLRAKKGGLGHYDSKRKN